MAWFTYTALVDGNVLSAADINTPLSNAANGTVVVANGGTGLTSGTSGGVPYFSGTTTIASSGLLTASALVLGGGAGAAPTSLALGTANQVLGMTNAATGHEYKTVTAGTGITVTHAANSITIAATAATGIGFVRGAIGITGSTTTYTCTSADMIAFYNPTSKTVEKVVTAQGSLTNTITTASARNGRDQAGAFSSSSWVYLYYTWDGATVATRSSAAAPPTGPTLANSETSWAFLGAYFLDGSTQFITTYTRGNQINYQAQQSLLNAGTATSLTSISLTSLVPPQGVSSDYRLSSLLHTDISGAPTNYSVTATFSLDNSSTFTTQRHAGNIGGGTGPVEITTPTATFPNISQTLYYKTAVTGGGATQSLTLNVVGYSVSNGG